MTQRFLLTTTCPLVLSLAFAVPANADTILVGTSLTGTAPAAVLCPLVNGCNTRLSQFSSPVTFNIDDIKVVIGGPAFPNFNTNGNFQVSMVTQPGTISSTSVPVGSGNLPITLMDSEGSNVGVFDFSGLSIPITAGTEYYLQVAGALRRPRRCHTGTIQPAAVGHWSSLDRRYRVTAGVPYIKSNLYLGRTICAQSHRA
jgi:hypothetical protein